MNSLKELMRFCHLARYFMMKNRCYAEYGNLTLKRDCFLIIFQVGGYILGEFGNLIAGDARSAPLVQFRLLHSKYHLCSQGMYYMFHTDFKMLRQFHVKYIYIYFYFFLPRHQSSTFDHICQVH